MNSNILLRYCLTEATILSSIEVKKWINIEKKDFESVQQNALFTFQVKSND